MSVITEYVANVPIRLKKPFDLNFIHQYGTVFKVFDVCESSGNLHFGVEKDGKRYFVKFAGAPKEKFDLTTPENAIEWLKESAKIYQDLEHESLIKLVRAEAVGEGYASIFEWTDAECIGSSFPLSREKFLWLPLEERLQIFDDIVSFHAHVANKEYVAIDFYSDQIMYDFKNKKTIICDIDFYQKSPYYGDKGLWGSSNFVSPEECTPGLRVDEITMVYTMGATAFSIFSDHDRSFEKWPLNESLYEVIKKAVSDDRNMRQQSIGQFIQEWNETLQYNPELKKHEEIRSKINEYKLCK